MNNKEILNNLKAFTFFQIIVTADHEFEGEVSKNKKHWNNDSVLTPENWDHHKATFYNQRFDKYKNEGLPKDMIIEEELEFVESLPNENKKYKRLKRLYTRYLKALSSQPTTNQKPELNGVEQNKVNFTNNFDAVDENEIYRYFYDKLVKKKMLTEAELNKFLKSAFQEKTPPKKRFKLKNVPTKGKVISIFYKYFKDEAQRPHGKQEQYASLLGEYFEGYKTSTIKTNFSK